MKKSKFFVILLILTMGSTMAFAGNEIVKTNTETMTVPVTRNKLMDEEINSMNERLEEMKEVNKSNLKEMKKDKKSMKKTSGGIYIGAGTLLIAILVIILLV